MEDRDEYKRKTIETVLESLLRGYPPWEEMKKKRGAAKLNQGTKPNKR